MFALNFFNPKLLRKCGAKTMNRMQYFIFETLKVTRRGQKKQRNKRKTTKRFVDGGLFE